MANRATVEPMWIRERSAVTARETMTALRGMFQPGVTYASVFEKGTPPSRAKDHNCLEAVATSLIVLAVSVMTRMVTMASVAARLLVVL